MSAAQSIIEFIKSLLDWWFVVEPWEQAIRVRFGKRVNLFSAGVYFKVPFFDQVYKQNVRRRVCDIPLITLTTVDGITISVHSSLGYAVKDVLKLHNTLQDAEMAVKQEALGHLTKFVVSHSMEECSPAAITAYVSSNINLEKYGLGEVEFFLSGFVAKVRTYRLISDAMHAYAGHSSGLTTTR
jgi:hypothetical protein